MYVRLGQTHEISLHDGFMISSHLALSCRSESSIAAGLSYNHMSTPRYANTGTKKPLRENHRSEAALVPGSSP